jgi:uncharacterized membrane protein YfcA
MEVVAIYLALGAVAGLAAGMFGIGGGVVIVPVLALVFAAQGFADGVSMHLAIGTSLATIVVTSISAMHAHHRRGAVQWRVFRQMVPGVMLGALLGAVVADFLPARALRIVFGAFELAVALQIGLDLMVSPQRKLPGQPTMTAAAVTIGAMSSVVGIGGGTLIVPFLVWCNMSIRRAVATSSACGLPLSAAGAVGFVAMGWSDVTLPAWSTGYLYWPALGGIAAASLLFAPLGATLAHVLPVVTLRRLFSAVLAVLGVLMLLG